MVIRHDEVEILDSLDLSDELVQRAYRDMAAIHWWLGDVRTVTRAIRKDALPVRRILDVGCATGLVLQRIGRKLGIEVVGADIQPRPPIAARVPIVCADGRFDALPSARSEERRVGKERRSRQ